MSLRGRLWWPKGEARAIAGNAGWLLFDRMVRLLLGFLVGAWVARYLGPAQFGEFAYLLAFLAFFQAIANIGADAIVVRDLASGDAEPGAILGATLRLRLLAGVACWAAWLLVTVALHPGDGAALLLAAVVGGALLFQAADTVDLWFQSRSQSRRTVLAKLSAYLLASGVKVALILVEAPLFAFAAAVAFEFALVALSLAIAYRLYPAPARWTWRAAEARRVARAAFPFMLSGLSVVVYMRIDQLMLKGLRGDYELGIYAAALPLSQLWNVIPVTLAISFAPMIARRKKEGGQAYEDALLQVFRLFGVIALAASVLTAALAPFLIGLVYGEEFAAAAPVLAIHVFSNIFVALGAAQGLWLTNEGLGRLSLIKTAIGGVIAVCGNLIAIPILGATGAAFVTLISFAASAWLSNAVLAPKIFLMQMGVRPSR